MSIIILGLGPGPWELLTLEAKEILENASEVYLRTRLHPIVSQLPKHLKVNSFDEIYEQSESFDEVYQTIVQRVTELGKKPEGILYAVPGHPLVAEATVRAILSRAKAEGIETRVVAGLSFLEPVFSLLEFDPLDKGLQIGDAHSVQIDPTLPSLIAQVYNQRIASALKVQLLELYPDEHMVSVVSSAGNPLQQSIKEMPLYMLDRQTKFDHLTCVYIPPLTREEDLGSVATLEHIMTKLRAPDGCPWDREQTHSTLKPYVIEEAYEVVEALDSEDTTKLQEELGDLLLQVIFHAQVATEEGNFNMRDVVSGITSKLIRRHPHVFGDIAVADAEEVLVNWEAIKRKEREEKQSMLDTIPKQMPALAYSLGVQKRAARVGFDWREIEGVIDKLSEEVKELQAVQNADERLNEFGDILFAVVNVGRWLNIDAEEALRLANTRFRERFAYMEMLCRERGLTFSELSLDQQNSLWDEAKQKLAEQEKSYD